MAQKIPDLLKALRDAGCEEIPGAGKVDRPEFHRRSLAARRIAPLQLYPGDAASGTGAPDRVVEPLDAIERVAGRGGPSWVDAALDALLLQHAEEALGHRVVVTEGGTVSPVKQEASCFPRSQPLRSCTGWTVRL